MREYTGLIIWIAVVAGVFALLWRMGYLVRLSQYVVDTREELKKCTWPTVEELKGSTVLVTLSVLMLGAFTAVVDVVVIAIVRVIVGT